MWNIKISEEKNELIGPHFVDTQAGSCRSPWPTHIFLESEYSSFNWYHINTANSKHLLNTNFYYKYVLNLFMWWKKSLNAFSQRSVQE